MNVWRAFSGRVLATPLLDRRMARLTSRPLGARFESFQVPPTGQLPNPDRTIGVNEYVSQSPSRLAWLS